MRLNYGVSGGFAALRHRTSRIISLVNKATRVQLGFFLVFAVLATGSLFAATTGSISGTVHDGQGAVVPNTRVVLRNTLTGVTQSITTDSAGFYSFPSLPIGHYDITFEITGFDMFVEKDLVLDVDSARRVDATLKPASVSEQITVAATADPAQVDTENAQMGEVIGQAQMDAVPLDGRNYTDLVALTPGVVPYNIHDQNYNEITPPNGGNDGSLSISGAQDVHTGYVVNGVDVEEGMGTSTFVMPVIDSIAEFRLVSNNSTAEYGGYSGGTINVVTKSGTNEFHGDAFEFLRNTSMNATTWGNTLPPTLHQNIYGGTVGGPVLKNKAFFFADYQGLRNSSPQNILSDVLSDANKMGDLSDRDVMQGNPQNVNGDYLATVLSNRLGQTVVNGEPYASWSPGAKGDNDPGFVCASTDPITGCVFPNGPNGGPVVPLNAWDPVAKYMLKYLPTSNYTNKGVAAYRATGLKSTNADDNMAFRGDIATPWGQLMAYYSHDHNAAPQPPPYGSGAPGIAYNTVDTNSLSAISLTTTFGSSAVNTAALGYFRNGWNQGYLPGSLGGITFEQQGFDTVENGGPAQLTTGPLATLGAIGFEGIGGGGVVTSWYSNIYSLADDFSKIIKTHSLKFGVQYHYEQSDYGHPQNASSGSFNISNTTGDQAADYMLGLITGMSQGTPAALNNRTFYAGAYAQDTWRATKDLTLSYGVRWEVNPFWRTSHNLNPVELPGLVSSRAPGAPVGYAFPGESGVPVHMANINWDNFGPRLGVAYTPDFTGKPILHTLFGDYGKSSIRAGYGLHFTNVEGFTSFNLAAPPYFLYGSTPTPGFLYEPWRDQQDGTLNANPFPPSPSNFNWATALPLAARRNPLIHTPSTYEEHFDLSIERQLTPKTILQVAYVGTFGHHLTVVANGNGGNVALCLSTPGCGPRGEDRKYTLADGTVQLGTRQGMGATSGSFQGVGLELNVGNSAYNSFVSTLRHTTERSMVLAAFTWAKNIDNGSGRGDIVFREDPNHFRGLSELDLPRNLQLTYQYELPIDKLIHSHDLIVRGWKFSGTTGFTDGVPIFITQSGDHNLRGDNRISPWGNGDDQPLLAPGNVKKGDHNIKHQMPWFDYTLFSSEPVGTQGNAPRRFILGPGNMNTNLAVMKDFKVRERWTLEFRAQAYNAFNHANFGGPNKIDGDFNDGIPSLSTGVNGGPANNTGGSFGMPPGVANDARRGELNLKLSF